MNSLLGGAVMMLAVIATAAGIVRYSTFYRREMVEVGNRALALDGLRGMAALAVATHHADLSCSWLITGKWDETPSQVLQLFAQGGVIVFFMLTGCLFWGKARAMNGKVDPWKLWRGRLYRIAPLYLFSLLILLVVAAIETGGQWISLENWKPLLRLFTLGALNWQNVGPVNIGEYNAGVVWTLRYEWCFYLVLPFIAWLAVGRKLFGVALIAYALVFVGLWFNLNLQPGLFFILGMLCPMLLENQRLRFQLVRPTAVGLAILLAVALSLLDRDYLFTKVPNIAFATALFPMFLVAAAGNNFFGFLTFPAVRCLGAISFSLYLLHGIIFRLVFHLLKTAGLSGLLQLDYWLIIVATAVAITLLCAATYRWIEFPFLSQSHKKPV
jgi:peptidoglycan/LPS O-acetylase OafA/YrhL